MKTPRPTLFLHHLRILVSALTLVCANSSLLAAESKQAFESVVLKSHTTASLTDAINSPEHVKENNLAEMPTGRQVLAGVPFDIHGILQLSGKRLIAWGRKEFPEKVENIAVGGFAEKIHLLHSAGGVFDPEETIIAKLVLHYDDKTQEAIEIKSGVHARDWWGLVSEKTTGDTTELAWTGSNPAIKKFRNNDGAVLRIYRTTFGNPQPSKKIETVDYLSTMNQASPFLVALTLERAEDGAQTKKPKAIQGVPPRDSSTKKNLIDLSNYFNGSLREGWLPKTDFGTTAEKSCPIPLGISKFEDIDFDVRGVLQLSGQKIKAAGGEFPEDMKNITVDLKCARLHFLHAASWGAFAEKGTKIGAFIVHHIDGSEREIPLVAGEDLGDWVAYDEEDYRNATRVWKDKTPSGIPVRLYKSKWENPNPELAIKTIDYVSKMTDASPFLVAITAE